MEENKKTAEEIINDLKLEINEYVSSEGKDVLNNLLNDNKFYKVKGKVLNDILADISHIEIARADMINFLHNLESTFKQFSQALNLELLAPQLNFLKTYANLSEMERMSKEIKKVEE